MVSTTISKKFIYIFAFLIFATMISACMESNEREDLLSNPTMTANLEPAQVQVTPTPASFQVELTPTRGSFSSFPSVATRTPYVYPTRVKRIYPDDGIVRIEVGEYFYDPNVVTITAGTTVEWVPIGVAEHTIVSENNQSGWPGDGGVGGYGDAPFRVTFTVPGVYSYFCSNHPGVMFGEVVVIGDSESP